MQVHNSTIDTLSEMTEVAKKAQRALKERAAGIANTLVLLLMLIPVSAQEREPTVQCPPGTICDFSKFDEYGRIFWDEEKARLDNVAAQFRSTPDNIIYIYVYNGRQGCVGEVQARAVRAKEYLVKTQGIHPDRVVWKDGGYRDDLTTEIWILPLGLTDPNVFPTVNPGDARLKDCSRERLKRGTRIRTKRTI